MDLIPPKTLENFLPKKTQKKRKVKSVTVRPPSDLMDWVDAMSSRFDCSHSSIVIAILSKERANTF